jgi:lipopolysaccharide/colanic/teichoic acid biosynthesis glycosyltransferase
MSLIGPRPPRPEEVRLDDATWRRALSLRPGMTGPALLVFGAGARNVEQIRELDLQYIQSRTMLVDLRLLLQTFATITRNRPTA